MNLASKRVSSARLRLLLLLGATAVAACASTPEIVRNDEPEGTPVEATTTEGVIHGVTDGDLHVFLGIPYAAPVAGLNRWLPPQPPAKRDEVFDASHFGPACEQTVASIPKWLLSEAGEVALYEMSALDAFLAEEKSGDCLRLNIWTPADLTARSAAPGEAPSKADASDDTASTVSALAEPAEEALPTDGDTPDSVTVDGGVTDAPESATASGGPTSDVDPVPVPGPVPPIEQPKGLPVMVHLHGGGLTSGSARHKAQNGKLMARKGVVVVTINYRLGAIGFLAGDGLFEGDVMKGNRGFMDTVRALEWIRDNIANFGGDPGNITLMGQSGGGTNVWSVLASPASEGLVHKAIIMSGPIYDYPIEDHKKLTAAVLEDWDAKVGDIDSVAKIEADDATSTATTTTLVGSDEFGAMSKTYLPSAGATGTEFLPDDILTAVKKGRLNNIDLLVGHCDDDAKVSIIMVPIPDSFAIDIWNGYIGGLVADTDEGFDAMTEKYIAAMPEVDETRAKEQLQTDALYRVRALKAAAMHSEQTKDASLGKTFTYQFNWKSPTHPEKLAAMHGMDLIMAFGHLDGFPQALGHKNGQIDPNTQKLSDGMLEAWASFAKTGTPSSDKLPEWPEYEPGARKTMVFDKESAVVDDPGGKLRKLWE